MDGRSITKRLGRVKWRRASDRRDDDRNLESRYLLVHNPISNEEAFYQTAYIR
jgi:hypothetical protein